MQRPISCFSGFRLKFQVPRARLSRDRDTRGVVIPEQGRIEPGRASKFPVNWSVVPFVSTLVLEKYSTGAAPTSAVSITLDLRAITHVKHYSKEIKVKTKKLY